jgi:hypothetical protein
MNESMVRVCVFTTSVEISDFSSFKNQPCLIKGVKKLVATRLVDGLLLKVG